MSESGRQGRPSGGLIPGLVKGLATTARSVTRRHHTVEYPDVKPQLPPRTRGVIALTEENCTSCMLCARECPDWCIYIDSHKEEIPATTPGGRARQRNVLDRFAIDFSLCMYCGICIEVCPFDALHWSPEFEYSELDIRDLLHEKERLGEWMATVPPPPALDPGSPEPAELAAINRPVRPAPGSGAVAGAAGAAAGEGAPAGRPARPATTVRRTAAGAGGAAATRRAAPAGTTPPPAVEPTEPAQNEPAPTETSAEEAADGADGPAGDRTRPLPKAPEPDETRMVPQTPTAEPPDQTPEPPDQTAELPRTTSVDETQALPPTRPEGEDS